MTFINLLPFSKHRVLCSFSHSCSWIKSIFNVPFGMWNFIFAVLSALMLLMSTVDMKKRLHIEIIYEFVRLICTWLVCNFSILHDLFEVNMMLLEDLHLQLLNKRIRILQNFNKRRKCCIFSNNFFKHSIFILCKKINQNNKHEGKKACFYPKPTQIQNTCMES